MTLTACLTCGWVHFAVSRAYVAQWQADWAQRWPAMDTASREAFGVRDGPPTDAQYLRCFRCGGGYRQFRDATEDEAPRGATLQPILRREEDASD